MTLIEDTNNKKRIKKKTGTKPTHGETKTRLYSIHRGIKQRCNNPKDTGYKYYGGKGIKLCDEWNDYIKFAEWAKANGYNDTLTIERIDSNGDYCPDNCTWATRKEQVRNRNISHFVTYKGQKMLLLDLAEMTNISYTTLLRHLRKDTSGKTDFDVLVDRILSLPKHKAHVGKHGKGEKKNDYR